MAGLRQLEKIYEEFPNEQDHKREINSLLDELCKVCGKFSYIPEMDMQNIIRDNILSDTSFYGLNAKKIYEWFDKVKGPYHARYMDEQSKKEQPEVVNAEPLTGEAKEAKIKEWLAAVNKILPPEKLENSGSKLRENLYAGVEQTERIAYNKPSLEELEERERHHAWIVANFDPKTAKPLPEFMEEEQWLKEVYYAKDKR